MIAPKNQKAWDGTIVLVAGPTHTAIPTEEFDRAIDQPFSETVDALRASLECCCDKVIYFSDLNEFTRNVGQHPNSLVFPYWFGQQSRSRHGLVPAVCEAANIMFVGADAFAKVVCNDKELSKVICQQVGLAVPRSAVLSDMKDLRYADYVNLPAVVKPNYEGTSLGITQHNLCRSWEEVSQLARQVFEHLGQPVIVEEFVSGREFSACLIGNSGMDADISVGAWVIEGDQSYLDERLNTFDLKLPNEMKFEFNIITQSFSEDTLGSFRKCFDSLGKAEMLRIDGRLTERGVTILELTPDIYLGDDGEFCLAFGYEKFNYSKFISRIVTNSLKGYEANVPVR